MSRTFQIKEVDYEDNPTGPSALLFLGEVEGERTGSESQYCAGFALFETPPFPSLCLVNIYLCLLEIPKRKTLITQQQQQQNINKAKVWFWRVV